jgi:GNAT superfamily N-acetyltransferase
MLTYLESSTGLHEDQLQGFFAHWGKAPSPHTLLRILRGSSHIVLARVEETANIVGYITAISDGVSCAYIPHLEVHPDWRGQGIGTMLVQRMLTKLGNLYMIDLMCDADVMPFYERCGFQRYTGMIMRNYDRQACA